MKIFEKKRVIIVLVLIAMVVGVSSFALASDSVNDKTLQSTITQSANPNAVIVAADPNRYENDEAKLLVTTINSDNVVTPAEIYEKTFSGSVAADTNSANAETPAEIYEKTLEDENNSGSEAVTTTTGEVVNLNLYSALTPALDLGLQTGNGITLNGSPGEVTVKVPQAIGLEGESLLIMQIDPKTGKAELITVKAFDSENGEMTAVFNNCGPIVLISKVPLVNKKPAPDSYPDQNVSQLVKQSNTGEYFSLKEWMGLQNQSGNSMTIEYTTSEVAQESENQEHVVYAEETNGKKSKTVNIDDYEAVTLLCDIAVRYGSSQYGYELSTPIKGNLYQDIDRTNWTKILNYAGIKYDLKEIKKNPKLLTEIEPFVLKNSFVYHIDASTGKVSYVYEPTISFDTFGEEEVGSVLSVTDNQDAQDNQVSLMNFFDHKVYADMKPIDQNKISWFDIDDVDEANTANLNLVISGEGYYGLGPFVLFMPKKTNIASLWWVWLILVVLIAAIIGLVIYSNKKKKIEQSH